MSSIAIALANELGTHIDDLVDEGVTELEMPDAGGEIVGNLLDTTLADEGPSNRFIALVTGRDGKRVRVLVTCEELA